ncbi:TetR/AcrR family transcriptional regulator [Streptomyces sp. NPDC002812]|uniref:TetR/AcrR family transcriptional regulator n=1 Tax=unclassified Streptomyces TaxID=2593676 RepID=UPI00202ECB60|nr:MULTISPECIES: TetR/AcrR family transcriptional regulator [unclassified Streptomyces]MCM1969358.1 TetR/AcrR family transcriptional regulator [Streptomyces sp. G1]MCX5127251.1 TetR/AcrR family transcriptional regulator [Streptomyces sp. NBC_00347]MCX5295316.1 TetR/AcrR family transcriptional regulator [Streptomyces sp. NBC_00193]
MSTPSQKARRAPAADREEPRRRADAERSIAAIVAAAIDCFRQDPNVSLTAVASAAGVSRVTLYAHFPSREALVDAVLDHSVGQADAALQAQGLDEGPADEAFSRLVRSGWRILERHAFLLAASEGVITPARRRAHHEKVLARVERVLVRGQAEGVFRTDLPLPWLVTTFYSLLHAAGAETDARHLKVKDVPDILDRTLSSILRTTPPS